MTGSGATSSQSSTGTLGNAGLGNSTLGGTSGLGTSGLGSRPNTAVMNGIFAPNQTNMLGAYYRNPLLSGLPNTNYGKSAGVRAQFGYPLYATPLSSTTAAAISRGISGGSTGMTSTGAPVRTGPRFTQSIGFDVNVPSATQFRSELQQHLSNVPSLNLGNQITVENAGGSVVLRGQAASERERDLAATILSFSPGVDAIRNEIVVRPPASPLGQPRPQPQP